MNIARTAAIFIYGTVVSGCGTSTTDQADPSGDSGSTSSGGTSSGGMGAGARAAEARVAGARAAEAEAMELSFLAAQAMRALGVPYRAVRMGQSISVPWSLRDTAPTERSALAKLRYARGITFSRSA